MPKKVLIAGFTGAMGQKAVSLVNQLPNFELVAGFAPKAVNCLLYTSDAADELRRVDL
ncbi:MAG: hypothetical protein N5848_09825, partial [Lactobacillus crispatus]|nr:hypothetical protein [Lactobacillus crispatus]MCT7709648.1 hypothetical protein [Lactobacillus crispatus]